MLQLQEFILAHPLNAVGLTIAVTAVAIALVATFRCLKDLVNRR